ncbi:MAG: cyanophycin synthetase [Actinomycetota bacterium]|nr:cyanophycin synthetase [Actinomycetota bacterium]
MEYLGNCRGIDCYNDSKATNPHATIAALDNFSKPLTLILGGKDKGMDLDDLFEAIDKKVSNLILLGESRKKIQDVLDKRQSTFNVHMVKSLKQGVDTGLSVTPSGGILLLSPAFASMDMFKDYKDRGNQFRAIIEERINEYR